MLHSLKCSLVALNLTLGLLLAGLALALPATWRASAAQAPPAAERQPAESELPTTTYYANLPLVAHLAPWDSPFGVESNVRLLPGTEILTRGIELGVGWVRLNERISWRKLQPSEDSPIKWNLLVNFEAELRALKAAGITPIVIADDYPRWATIIPNSCSPLRPDKYQAYANFMASLVERYKTDEFNVHIWELGNEVDIDPSMVDVDSIFGCWGDIDDLDYYGGVQYGEMVKVAAPAIKAADPTAKVWIAGLLMGEPITTDPNLGHPENFLRGILHAGAAPYFDVVPYHWYPGYPRLIMRDYDIRSNSWVSWGGGTVGKARFLRQLMAEYGVSKPVILNETGLSCNPVSAPAACDGYGSPPGPSPMYYEVRASYLVRSFVRGWAEGVQGFAWYTLNGPAWRYTGLLDSDNDPTGAYYAYQRLIIELDHASFNRVVNYGSTVEAYAFHRAGQEIQVAWTMDDVTSTIQIPNYRLLALRGRAGEPITPTLAGDTYQITLVFTPTYIILTNP
jgi:hypothetical protein